jgi:hypothetical protein
LFVCWQNRFGNPKVIGLCSLGQKRVNRINLVRIPLLKVPKREIFDRSDFPDFYTIKSLRVGDFRVKIKKN